MLDYCSQFSGPTPEEAKCLILNKINNTRRTKYCERYENSPLYQIILERNIETQIQFEIKSFGGLGSEMGYAMFTEPKILIMSIKETNRKFPKHRILAILKTIGKLMKFYRYIIEKRYAPNGSFVSECLQSSRWKSFEEAEIILNPLAD